MNDIEKLRKIGRKYVYIQFLLFLLLILSVHFERKLLHLLESETYKITGIFILAAGLILLLITLYNFAQPVTPNPVPRTKARLRTHGIYSFIRHPMYFSLMVISFGYVIINQCILSLSVIPFIFIFFINKIKLEEFLLEVLFPQYKDYANKTKKIIPFIY